MNLEGVKLSFGTVRYIGGEDEVPASVVRDGNVTVHNEGRPGRAPYYDVSFQISASVAEGDVSEYVVFTISVPVLGKNGQTPYGEIETEAAKQLAPILRLFSEEIDKQVREAEQESRPD